MPTTVDSRVLLLTLAVLDGFGLIVAAAALVLHRRGVSPGPLLKKYCAWFLIAPVFVVPLVFSRVVFQAVILLVSLQCIREFLRAAGLSRDRWVAGACYLLTAAVYAPVFLGREELSRAAPLVVIGALVAVPIIRGRGEEMLRNVSLSILAVLYFGWFLSHLAGLRNHAGGIRLAFILFALVSCNDALGYLWGRWLGRHRLSPVISPRKTVEGAAMALVTVTGIALLLDGFLRQHGAVPAMAAVAAVTAVLGILGDLVVSSIKRNLHVKDMGDAIPGHGGFLDRCDSLFLAAPAFYYLAPLL